MGKSRAKPRADEVIIYVIAFVKGMMELGAFPEGAAIHIRVDTNKQKLKHTLCITVTDGTSTGYDAFESYDLIYEGLFLDSDSDSLLNQIDKKGTRKKQNALDSVMEAYNFFLKHDLEEWTQNDTGYNVLYLEIDSSKINGVGKINRMNYNKRDSTKLIIPND